MPPGGGQVVPGRPGVAGVEADARATGARPPRRSSRPEVLHPGGQRAPAAGGRLDQQPRAAGRGRRVQQRQQRLAYLPQRARRAASSTALPAWKTTPRAPIAAPAAQRVRERLRRPLHRRRGGGAEVDQQRRVDVRRARPARRSRPGTPRPGPGRRPAAPSRVGWRRTPAPPAAPAASTYGRAALARPPAVGTCAPPMAGRRHGSGPCMRPRVSGVAGGTCGVLRLWNRSIAVSALNSGTSPGGQLSSSCLAVAGSGVDHLGASATPAGPLADDRAITLLPRLHARPPAGFCSSTCPWACRSSLCWTSTASSRAARRFASRLGELLADHVRARGPGTALADDDDRDRGRPA